MRPSFNLTEAQIRYAMSNTSSCKEAAKFLNLSYNTFKKYARMYRDSASGKSLQDIHRMFDSQGKRLKPAARPRIKIPHIKLDDILAGKHPDYPERKFRWRMFASQLIPAKCSICDFAEHRVTDNKIPLVLDYIDDNRLNKTLENLRFLCYNCYFLNVGTYHPSKPRIRLNSQNR